MSGDITDASRSSFPSTRRARRPRTSSSTPSQLDIPLTDIDAIPWTESPKRMHHEDSFPGDSHASKRHSLASQRSRSASPTPTPSSASTRTSTTLSFHSSHLGAGSVAHPDPDILRSDKGHSDEEDTPYTALRPFLPHALDPDPSRPQHVVPRMDDNYFEVRACQCEFGTAEQPPKGWTRLTHPDGRPFFWHQQYRALTMEWMMDNAIANCVNAAIDHVYDDFHHCTGRETIGDCQLVIGLETLEALPGQYAALYYLVDPEKECVFWVEDYSLTYELWVESEAALEPQMVGIYLRYQYYKHWDNFPNVQKTSPQRILEWQKILDDARSGKCCIYNVPSTFHQNRANTPTDVVFSNTSTVNYTAKELTNMIEMVDSMLGRAKAAKKLHVSLEGEWLPGRMMQNIYHDQFMNLYSQRGARADRQQSVFNNSPTEVGQSWFIILCGLFLFWAPQHHLTGLNRMWVDRMLAKEPWRNLVNTLVREWEGHRVVATILLAANVSFLGVDNLPEGLVQIACYLSAISSSTSFVLITALEGRIRQMEKHDIVRAQEWLKLLNNENIGLEILAVLLGLPYGLTMWSVIMFTVSFMAFCMHDVKSTTALIVSIYFGWHLVVLLWSLWISQEGRKTIHDHKRIPAVVVKKAGKGAKVAGKAVKKPIRKMTRSLTIQVAKRSTRWSGSTAAGSGGSNASFGMGELRRSPDAMV
ncbi:hypothetical protein HDZ31DRAFT_28980 [Schizophyllum fasciatum]